MAPLNPDYSFTTVSTDGPITGPRWVHWLVKIITGLAFALPFILWLHWLPVYAFVPGYLLILMLKVVDLHWWHFVPIGGTLRPWTFTDFRTADVATDSMLHWAGLLPFLCAESFAPQPLAMRVLHIVGAVLWCTIPALIFRRNYPWAQP